MIYMSYCIRVKLFSTKREKKFLSFSINVCFYDINSSRLLADTGVEPFPSWSECFTLYDLIKANESPKRTNLWDDEQNPEMDAEFKLDVENNPDLMRYTGCG